MYICFLEFFWKYIWIHTSLILSWTKTLSHIKNTYTQTSSMEWFFLLNTLLFLNTEIFLKYFPLHIPEWNENLRFIQKTEIEQLSGTSKITVGMPCLEKQGMYVCRYVCISLSIYLLIYLCLKDPPSQEPFGFLK